MEDELRLSLLVVGTLIILGVLAHGIWKIRKSNKPDSRERVEPGEWDNSARHRQEPGFEHDGWDTPDDDNDGPSNDFDDLGLGKVRVVSASRDAVSKHGGKETSKPASSDKQNSDSANSDTHESSRESLTSAPEEKLYGSVVSNPKPHMAGSHASAHETDEARDAIPEPPGFLLKGTDRVVKADPQPDDNVPSFSLDSPAAQESQPEDTDSTDRFMKKRRSRAPSKQRQEPGFGDDQMRIDFDEPASQPDHTHASSDTGDTRGHSTSSSSAQEVLILNVKAAEDNEISGAALLPLLLTLGFKFGDQDIFHRHVNSNGKGPVLFSLANMFKPGSFDIDNLETFSTKGVSLFMILPIEGDAHQVFNMMHNAARKIADEFDAQVLDGRRSVLSKQGLQQYIEKIRDFERRRIVSRA
ncbi:cell division protein ZipA [Salinimonas sp. HHU 13199]|uniref:Cell division protein ZipA n=1 Tax=Salinimonas profundi TaxID=2729140 RepID=A0ABR8LE93_9ALTE|nr:cell division protein ZipA [Salinimonas profundi]MBD3584611.1 cell division protein ZipA [Salinimonas profundi]